MKGRYKFFSQALAFLLSGLIILVPPIVEASVKRTTTNTVTSREKELQAQVDSLVKSNGNLEKQISVSLARESSLEKSVSNERKKMKDLGDNIKSEKDKIADLKKNCPLQSRTTSGSGASPAGEGAGGYSGPVSGAEASGGTRSVE